MRPENHATTPLPEAAMRAMALIPCGLFVMTTAFEDRAAGVLVKLVQVCAPAPPLIAVAMLRGQSVEPLIRDSRAFALCQISDDDRLLQKKFAPNEGRPGGERCMIDETPEDPFVSLAVRPAPSGSPIIDRAIAWLDCELERSVELDPDHRLYVGRITHGDVLDATRKPAVIFGSNGTKGER